MIVQKVICPQPGFEGLSCFWGHFRFGTCKKNLWKCQRLSKLPIFKHQYRIRNPSLTWNNSRACSTSIFHFSRAYNSEMIHFWPHVAKAKMCLKGVHLIWIVNKKLKIVNKQLKKQNKCMPLKHIFDLPTCGQKWIIDEF